jgi:hypothetical protein
LERVEADDLSAPDSGPDRLRRVDQPDTTGEVSLNHAVDTQPHPELSEDRPANPPATTSPARPGLARRLPAIGAVLAGTLLICAHASLYGRWIIDDAAITFAYARNITEGFGPVIQPGAAPVEGYSNTSWMLLLMLGRWLGLFDHGSILGVPDYVVYPKLLAVLCCAATLVAFHRIAAVLVRRPWIVTLVAGTVLASIPSYVAWSFSGLENSLYAFLVTAIAAVTVSAIAQQRLHRFAPAVVAGLLAVAAALTRPDGMIFAFSFPLVVLLMMTRPTLRAALVSAAVSLASFAIPFGAFLLWRHAEFGRFVSNTAAAKSQTVGLDVDTILSFNKIGDLAGYIGAVGALVALLIIGAALGKPAPFRRGLMGALVPLALSFAAFGILNADWMDQFRFATPIWALGSLTVVLCAYRVLTSSTVRTRVACGLAVVLALTMTVPLLEERETSFRTGPTVPLCLVADSAGRLVNEMADLLALGDNEVYLGPDLGGSALTSRVRIADLAGLTDARIADLRRDGGDEALADYVYEDLRPALVHAEQAWKIRDTENRAERDYYFLDNTDPAMGGSYVRKDLVASPAVLEKLRALKQTGRDKVFGHYHGAPRASCGDKLSPGQVLAGSER